MTETIEDNANPDKGEHLHHLVRLPGFIVNEEIELGDVIKRNTSYFRIQPCAGYKRRSAASKLLADFYQLGFEAGDLFEFGFPNPLGTANARHLKE
jgi:hypothetical protein